MNVELAIQTMTSFDRSLELASWAEGAGLAAFAVADHYVSSPSDAYALDQLTVLAAVAARTERIALASLVSPITFRHPAVLHKTGVTLDEISGGRFSLGVGAGWLEIEHRALGLEFPPLTERFARLEDALAYLHAARAGADHAGPFYRLGSEPTPLPRGESLRLVVGGSGRHRTPTLAGRYADEFNVFPAEASLEERVGTARAAAAAAGRDPASLQISMAFPLVLGADATDLESRVAAVASARRTDPDRILTRWPALGIPVGTAERFRERLEELSGQGVERVYFQVAFDTLEDIRRSVGLLLD